MEPVFVVCFISVCPSQETVSPLRAHPGPLVVPACPQHVLRCCAPGEKSQALQPEE